MSVRWIVLCVLVVAVNVLASADIDRDIENADKSLSEIESLLKKLRAEEGDNSTEFAQLAKHVHLIKEQLRIVQEEFAINKNLDRFIHSMEDWKEEASHLESRLKRNLQRFHS